MKSYICCGMQYGDEGKGSFVDWLTHEVNASCVVKYNGGCQASHSVETPENILHKFAQLGSGMFKDGCHTYITKEMIVNPDNLCREIAEFSQKTAQDTEDVKKRIHIHKDCLVVTPYHKLLNRLRELSLGENRRGSVGIGVSEVPVLWDIKLGISERGIGMKMSDLYSASVASVMGCLSDIYEYTKGFYNANKDMIMLNCPADIKEELEEQISYFLLGGKSYQAIASDMWQKFCMTKQYDLKECLYESYDTTLRKKHETVVWEGSQGFLIDKKYGIYPNTTNLITTNEPALDIAYLRDEIRKIGITKAFCSRHGMGVFVTEDIDLQNYIKDANQDCSFWNGSQRYGWFDVPMFRYADRVNNVDEIYLSSLDKLNGLDKVKICTKYKYNGEINEEFKQTFDFYHEWANVVYIVGIKNNNKNIKKWLSQCAPVYQEFNGWEEVFNNGEIAANCIAFLENLQTLIKKKITVISAGPTRNNKMKVRIENVDVDERND